MYRQRIPFLPVVLGLSLLLTSDAFGRAGGGQNYVAPSRSSSSSSSRSSSSSSSRSSASSSSRSSSWFSGSSSSSHSPPSHSSSTSPTRSLPRPSGVSSSTRNSYSPPPVYVPSPSPYVPPPTYVPPPAPVRTTSYVPSRSSYDYTLPFAFFLAVGLVAFLVWRYNANEARLWQQASADEPPPIPRRAQGLDAALAQLQQDDPAFDLQAFLRRSSKVFLDIQEAWFLRDLSTARVYMSDGLHRRFTTLLTLMQQDNLRNALADAAVQNARLMEISRTKAFDCLTVRIDASLRDTDVSASFTDEEAREAAKQAGAVEFTELWTFVRRRGLQTKSEFDLSQGRCPNCGAAFTGGATNKCEFCNAIINSGNYDWVLSEITQSSEYEPHDRKALGLTALREKDPDAAAEVLEDRALLLFWKYLEVWAFADARRAQKVAVPKAVAGFRQELEALSTQGSRFLVRKPAVGGADLVEIAVNSEGVDRAYVEVRWSAAMGVGDVSRQEPQPFTSIVTMVRSAAATTDRGIGLSNERCGKCGAPLTDSDSTACDFCGQDLSEASRDWLLETIVPKDQWRR